jgi:hypothetical protein
MVCGRSRDRAEKGEAGGKIKWERGKRASSSEGEGEGEGEDSALP